MALASNSHALVKRTLDTSLMPPPPPPKRIKRPAKVLDENDYTDALSHIIARDFFPGLLETETKQEYLDALDSRDPRWIASAEKKLTEVMTPGPDGRRLRGRRGTSLTPKPSSGGFNGETPRGWQGDTPGSTISTSTSITNSARSAKPDIDTNMSLTAFQEKYTSEDNESFYKLMDKQNQKRSENYSWMWAGNKIPAARQIAYRKRQALLTAQEEEQKAENDGKELAIVAPVDTRKAMPDTWKVRPDNSLMFSPSSIEDSLQTVAQSKEETSSAPPKAVVYDNTRLPTTSPSIFISANNVPPSPSLSAVQDAIAGQPRHSEASFNGASTPRVNGYSFVDDRDPSPPPPSSTATSSSSDALHLLSGDSTPNPFKLLDSSRRESLHHRMVEKVSRSKRLGTGRRDSELRSQAAQTPKFMSSPMMGKVGRTSAGLTPAGEKLMGKVGGITPLRGGASSSPAGLWEGRAKTPKVKGGAATRLRQGWTPNA